MCLNDTQGPTTRTLSGHTQRVTCLRSPKGVIGSVQSLTPARIDAPQRISCPPQALAPPTFLCCYVPAERRLSVGSMRSLPPGGAPTDRHIQRDGQVGGGAHLLTQNALDSRRFARGDLDEQLVVDLQEQS